MGYILGGASKVQAMGPGLGSGQVNKPCEFMVYSREAGAGGLTIAVEGPSKAEIDFQDRRDGSCSVSYRVSEPGIEILLFFLQKIGQNLLYQTIQHQHQPLNF